MVKKCVVVPKKKVLWFYLPNFRWINSQDLWPISKSLLLLLKNYFWFSQLCFFRQSHEAFIQLSQCLHGRPECHRADLTKHDGFATLWASTFELLKLMNYKARIKNSQVLLNLPNDCSIACHSSLLDLFNHHLTIRWNLYVLWAEILR